MSAKRVRFILLVICFFILQFFLFPQIPFRGAIPDILSCAIVFYAYYVRRYKLIAVAIMIGLVRDVISFEPFGSFMISYVITSYGLWFIIKKFPQENLFFRSIMATAFTAVSHIILLVCTLIFIPTDDPLALLMAHAVPTVLYTALLAPVFLWILHFTMRDSLRQYNLF